MVSRPSYHEEEEPSFRRYSARGQDYPLSHGREPPSYNVYQRPAHHGGQDSRDRSAENEEIPRTRSRIPVACARCRKRKIRCSGDSGGPCTNCKGAGHDPCIFLRVSSMDAPMKTETPPFEFDTAASRPNCRMGAFGPPGFASPQASLSLDQYPYRPNSLSSYQYGMKNYYMPSSYNDFGEENMDYGMQQYMPADQIGLGSSYSTSGPARTWVSTPNMPKGVYLESPTPMYAHSQPPFNGGSFDMRTPLAAEQKPMALGPVNPSLPAPSSNGLDRLLPFPTNLSVNRSVQVNQYLPSSDSILPVAHARGAYYDYGAVQTLKSQNNQAMSENSTTSSSPYASMSTNSPDSLSSPSNAYPTPPFSLPQSQPEVYTPPHENLYQDSYGHSNGSDNSKRGSHSSQGGQHDGLPSLSQPTPVGALSNGRAYIPPIFNSPGIYNTPIIDSHQPQPIRRPSGVLA